MTPQEIIDCLDTEAERKFATALLDWHEGRRKSKPPKPKDMTSEVASVIRERIAFALTDFTPAPFPAIPVPLEKKDPPERFSVTRLRAAEKCLLSTALARDYDATGTPAVVGNVVHEVLERLAMHFWARPNGGNTEAFLPDEEEAVLLAERMLEEPAEALPLSYFQMGQVLQMVRHWARHTLIYPDRGQWVEFGLQVPFEGEIVSGRIDLIQVSQNHAVITDYKTAQRMIPQAEFAESIQTFLYAWGLWASGNLPGVEMFTVREMYVRYDAHPREVTIHADQFEAVERYLSVAVKRLRKAYEEDTFPPTVGDHCALCPRPQACPKKGISEYVPGDEGHAVRLLEWLIVTDAQVAQARKTLKAEITQAGHEVTKNGMTASYRHIHSESLDKEALADVVDLAQFTVPADKTEFKVRKARPEVTLGPEGEEIPSEDQEVQL